MNRLKKALSLSKLTALLLSISHFAMALPTESRVWETTSGHKTTAVALKVVDSKVHFKKPNNSVIKVNLDLLSDADQQFLIEFFKITPSSDEQGNDSLVKGSNAKPLTGLSQPQGKVVGPIESDGSHYYLYLPKSLKEGRLAPLLFYTNSGGARKNGNLINVLSDGAEALGWIMAISVESSNKENWPVDKNRIHYTGNSGGAARAFHNSVKTRAFGVMPNVGYIPSGAEIKTEVIYAISGGFDYNRYLSAYAAKTRGKDGFHRMTNKGHGNNSHSSYYVDGMIWMHCKFMDKKKSKLRDEAADFEASIITWINNIKSSNPERAYANACVVRDEYDMSGKNEGILNDIISELAKDNNNVLYHEALGDINDLSNKLMAPLGRNNGSLHNHFHAPSSKAAKKLKQKYSGVKSITEVLDAIMKSTK